jgi:glutamyl-tRNA synthetase
MKKEIIRVRIAPSPTGYLHIGTARTALFNWLFAKKNKGKFVLRIEDTDLERSDVKYEKDIIEGLKWLGLDWDEGPYRQSERLDIYEKYVNQLLDEGAAYYCFCSKEELETERQAMLAQGFAPKYSGKCRALNSKEVKTKLKKNEGHVIRFKVPETTVSFRDLIRGEISFDASLIGDIAIAKDPRVPLYNFAVVVDDEEMRITHVIRGEDHIANTPKQILLQKALGFHQPHYAHLPLILDPDRSKMSKRHSATSIQEYKEAGYLPEALINFMALLGWHPAPQPSVEVRGKPRPEKEMLSLTELVQEFDLSRVQKAGAVFNIEKLDWLNAQYIKNLSDEELAKKLEIAPTEENLKIVALTKERMKKLTDFKLLAKFFFELPDYEPELLVWKSASQKTILENLKYLEKVLSDVDNEEFSKSSLEKILMPIAEERGRGEMLWPLRAALSGQETSPGPFEIMDALGKKETLRRIAVAIRKLEL